MTKRAGVVSDSVRRHFVLLIALTACSSKSAGDKRAPAVANAKGSTAPPETVAEVKAEPPVEVATLISPDVTGVMVASGQEFPIVTYTTTLFQDSVPPCWSHLTAAITTGYQLEQAGTSYFILEGALPRAAVEQCVATAFSFLKPTITRDGELLVMTVRIQPSAPVYAAWRGGTMIVGSKSQVQAALTTTSLETENAWRQRIAALPRGMMSMWRADALLHNLFGVATESYMLVIDRAGKTPTPHVEGRVIAEYASAKAAASAARNVKAGKLQIPDPPPELVAAVKRFKLTQTGEQLELGFSAETFAGLEVEKLQAYFASLAALPPP